MGEHPLVFGEAARGRELPSYEGLGLSIEFSDFLKECQHLVSETYLRLWEV